MKLTVEQINTGFHQVWLYVEKQDTKTHRNTSEFLKKPGNIFQDAIEVSSYSILIELGKLDTSKAPSPCISTMQSTRENHNARSSKANQETLVH